MFNSNECCSDRSCCGGSIVEQSFIHDVDITDPLLPLEQHNQQQQIRLLRDRSHLRNLLENGEDIQSMFDPYICMEAWLHSIANNHHYGYPINMMMLEDAGYQHLGIMKSGYHDYTSERNDMVSMMSTFVKRHGSLFGFPFSWANASLAQRRLLPGFVFNLVNSNPTTTIAKDETEIFWFLDCDLLSLSDRTMLLKILLGSDVAYELFKDPCNLVHAILHQGIIDINTLWFCSNQQIYHQSLKLAAIVDINCLFHLFQKSSNPATQACILQTVLEMIRRIMHHPIYNTDNQGHHNSGKQLFQHIVDFALHEALDRFDIMRDLIETFHANPNAIVPIKVPIEFCDSSLDIRMLQAYFENLLAHPSTFWMPHCYEEERWSIGEVDSSQLHRRIEGWTLLHKEWYSHNGFHHTLGLHATSQRVDYLLNKTNANPLIHSLNGPDHTPGCSTFDIARTMIQRLNDIQVNNIVSFYSPNHKRKNDEV